MTAALTLTKPTYSLAPQSFEEALKFSELVARSDLAPKDYKGKPGNVLIAVQMGAEIGLSPMQSLSNIAVINGRASVWGDAMLAVCSAHSAFEDINETDDGTTATCVVTRKGRTPITRTFSMEDARTAGLANKEGPWRQYPKRMRQMRARAFALRDAFPDALRGLQSAEESQDLPPIKATLTPIARPSEPKPELTDPIARKLQEEIDAGKTGAIDPEADPGDYAVKRDGKWLKLRDLGPKQLRWLIDNGKPEQRKYAGAYLMTLGAAKEAEFEEMTKGSYLDENGGATPDPDEHHHATGVTP